MFGNQHCFSGFSRKRSFLTKLSFPPRGGSHLEEEIPLIYRQVWLGTRDTTAGFGEEVPKPGYLLKMDQKPVPGFWSLHSQLPMF